MKCSECKKEILRRDDLMMRIVGGGFQGIGSFPRVLHKGCVASDSKFILSVLSSVPVGTYISPTAEGLKSVERDSRMHFLYTTGIIALLFGTALVAAISQQASTLAYAVIVGIGVVLMLLKGSGYFITTSRVRTIRQLK